MEIYLLIIPYFQPQTKVEIIDSCSLTVYFYTKQEQADMPRAMQVNKAIRDKQNEYSKKSQF